MLKVKDGYAQDTAALLQTGYQQVLDYCRMYSMNVAQVEQARLFVSGDYVALLILGQGPDDSTADEAKLAQDRGRQGGRRVAGHLRLRRQPAGGEVSADRGAGESLCPPAHEKTAAGQIPSCNLPRHVVQ